MRMSCNGCRVLRKGCGDDCSIKPCLRWIKSPESQANATVFLAKFYGRAGLMNLINAGPDHLRPAIFRSLLYEACGRIVNPIYGSVGLLLSGSWQLTQAAVEAVLKGAPIVQIPSETAASTPTPPLKAYDIRHLSKDPGAGGCARAAAELHKVNKAGSRFKRSGAKAARPAAIHPLEFHKSTGSDSTEPAADAGVGGGGDEEWQVEESMSSADIAEASSHVSQGEPDRAEAEEDGEVGLELTLGSRPFCRSPRDESPRVHDPDACTTDLGLAS
ncbi:hypothetical protein C4D60_Mb04t03690 [Musa balbisiana]|uniref:LOB domain-containing protein n=1 Tax=Musa balbisiana TaxID=52838 RepID=A0A4S8K9D5_MUSBA|nr:hypothetical protein C4D60_Mb04t03690 [Musa balbisiana]